MASFWRVPILERGRLRGEPLSLLLSLAIQTDVSLQHAIVLGRLIEGLGNLESGLVLTIAAKKRTVRCAALVLVLVGSGGSGGMTELVSDSRRHRSGTSQDTTVPSTTLHVICWI
jgi:hypothetical protein